MRIGQEMILSIRTFGRAVRTACCRSAPISHRRSVFPWIKREAEVTDAVASKTFAASYITLPMWEEPLRKVAEQVRLYCDDVSSQATAIENGAKLVTMALGIAPIFASDLLRLGGPAVWASVGGEVGKTLRAWFAIDEPNHRRSATAAILATGSVDFSDVLLPLLTNADRQVRVSTYDASDAFYPESLGVKWRETVANWDEDARADFVSEVTHRGYMADVGEYFAINDPSEKVRREAISGLVWISASDTLGRVVTALDDMTLAATLPSFVADAVPTAVRSRMAAAYRRIAGNTAGPVNRIRSFLQANEYGDTDMAGGLTTALSELKAPVDQYAPHAIMEALKIIGTSDTAWVNAWVAARLLDGTLWDEHWYQFLGPATAMHSGTPIFKLGAVSAVSSPLSTLSAFGLAVTMNGVDPGHVFRRLGGRDVQIYHNCFIITAHENTFESFVGRGIDFLVRHIRWDEDEIARTGFGYKFKVVSPSHARATTQDENHAFEGAVMMRASLGVGVDFDGTSP